MISSSRPSLSCCATPEEITAFADFPEAHWRKIWSTNPLGRLNKRSNDESLLRLSACALIEAHDEWQVCDRRYFSETSMAPLTPSPPTALEPRRDDNATDTAEVIDTTTIKTA